MSLLTWHELLSRHEPAVRSLIAQQLENFEDIGERGAHDVLEAEEVFAVAVTVVADAVQQ